ncbi:hypothetical protein GF386_00510 [Candidatus Pacearchaeota archaeon]|nr:hypothetical protein [Candidatus Pacearchaeota archaeon]MBD3282744.1 hypothetical protein [Candidatus Pacearchaeota archaeon]
MPGGDRTGPAGQGSMTGRKLGYCSGSNNPGFANSGFGRGLGRGLGRGFAWRARAIQNIQQPVVITEKQEKEYLEQELETLKQEMKEIEERLKQIKK